MLGKAPRGCDSDVPREPGKLNALRSRGVSHYWGLRPIELLSDKRSPIFLISCSHFFKKKISCSHNYHRTI